MKKSKRDQKPLKLLNGLSWEILDKEFNLGELFIQMDRFGPRLNCKSNCHRCPWGDDNDLHGCIVGPRVINKAVLRRYPELLL